MKEEDINSIFVTNWVSCTIAVDSSFWTLLGDSTSWTGSTVSVFCISSTGSDSWTGSTVSVFFWAGSDSWTGSTASVFFWAGSAFRQGYRE